MCGIPFSIFISFRPKMNTEYIRLSWLTRLANSEFTVNPDAAAATVPSEQLLYFKIRDNSEDKLQ